MSHPNPSTALARVLVDELARCGLTDAVLAPGSRSTALAYALQDHPGVSLHVEIDERSAGFLAVGLARGSGRPAAVVTTSGTATANLFPAVIEADAARVPLLLLTADRPPELRHTAANQTIDQVKLHGDRVRWFCEVGVAEDLATSNAYWRATACRAWAAAAGVAGAGAGALGGSAGAGGAGPVHLNLAFREPTVPAVNDGRVVGHATVHAYDGRADDQPWTRTYGGARRLDAGDLHAWSDRIAATRRGLIVLGDCDVDRAALADLAEATGWPVLAEVVSSRRGGGAISHAHLLLGVPEFATAHRPDLVIRVGRTGLSRPLEQWLDSSIPQVVVDADGAWLDPARSAAAVVAADPSWWCHDVAARLARLRRDAPQDNQDGDAWMQAWRRADAAAAVAVGHHLDDAKPSGPGAARATLASVPAVPGATLVVASSAPVRDLDAYSAARDDVRVVANRGASGIDGFVSTALGVALATDGPTVALAGDLSFLHDQSGLLLRPDRDVDLVLVVIDNDGGGLFHQLPQAAQPHFERLFATPHGIDLRDVAHAHRVAASLVTSLADLRQAIGVAVESGGVHVLVVPTDRSADVDVRASLRSAVAASLAALAGAGSDVAQD